MSDKPKPENPFEQQVEDPWDQGTNDTTDKAWFGAYKPEEFVAVLVVMNCADASMIGQLHVLGDEVTIGRSSQATITVDDPAASRRHVMIQKRGDRYVARDLGSSNGTFINGRKIEDAVLQAGDRVQLGSDSTVFKFSLQDKLEKSFHEALYDGSYRDGLTGVFNKRYFTERLEAEFAFALRHQRVLTVGLMDLDDFKKINDTYGHLAGDAVLRQVSSTAERALRTEDVFARIGGEEFALILRDTDIGEAAKVAERVLSRVRETTVVHLEHELSVTVSLGMARYGEGQPESVEELVAEADQRLYEAKSAGKDTYRPR